MSGILLASALSRLGLPTSRAELEGDSSTLVLVPKIVKSWAVPEVSAEQGTYEQTNGIITAPLSLPSYQEQGGSFTGVALRVSGTSPGKRYLALRDCDFRNNNVTWAWVMWAAIGQPYPAYPQVRIVPTLKLDVIAMDHHLRDLLMSLTTHSLVRNADGSRTICVEEVVIPGVFEL